jgi:NAD(P)-dependent dehydrogenase (short-subunit alcohol dehydrogenase family)
MGEALARDLVSKGWKVACADIQEGPGETLAKELGPNAKYFKCNIADYDDQARMYKGVWETWGRLDALCANAGIVDQSSIYILDHRGSDEYLFPSSTLS